MKKIALIATLFVLSFIPAPAQAQKDTTAVVDESLPPGEEGAKAALEKSPRHGEYADVKVLGKTYEVNIYEGAGHGFLRAQSGREGANLRASQQAWPRTVAFLRKHTR